MRCKKAKVLLSVAMDGELSQRETLAVERHVGACLTCAREHAELSVLREAMAAWADEEPSPWLAMNFAHKLQGLGRAAPAREARPTWRRLAGAAAGLAVAVIVAIVLLQSRVQPPERGEIARTPVIATQGELPAPDTSGISKQEAGGSEVIQPQKTQVPPRPHRPRPVYVAHEFRTAPPTGSEHPRGEVILAGSAAPPSGEPNLTAMPQLSIAEAAQGAVTIKVTRELTTNESIERVRGNLQRMADLLVSRPPTPASDTTITDGGETL
jgi:hypothetical protein